MYQHNKLDSGLNLVTVPMKGTRTVTVLVLVGAGSKYETKQNNGISHFLEHMFFKGTKNRPNTMDIATELDGVGASYNAFTDKECTGYWVKLDATQKKLGLDVVSDMLLNSKFAQEEIDRERGVITEEINMYHDNPLMYIDDVFEECLYGDTPAGWEIIGPKKNIKKFQRKDFLDYFKKQYGAENTVVCIAGNVDSEDSKKVVEDYFKKIRQTQPRKKQPVQDKQSSPQIKLKYKDTDQVSLALGVRAYPVDHEDEFTAKMISTVLGGSMSSRLFTQLRERGGLAYYVRTFYEAYSDSGYIATQAGVPKNKLDRSIDIILKEYQRIKDEGLDEKELQRTKDLIRGRMVLQLEGSDNVANWYARQATFRKDIFTLKKFLDKIDKVTAEDVKRVGEDIFQNKGLNLALIGPFKEKAGFKKKLYLN